MNKELIQYDNNREAIRVISDVKSLSEVVSGERIMLQDQERGGINGLITSFVPIMLGQNQENRIPSTNKTAYLIIRTNGGLPEVLKYDLYSFISDGQHAEKLWNWECKGQTSDSWLFEGQTLNIPTINKYLQESGL